MDLRIGFRRASLGSFLFVAAAAGTLSVSNQAHAEEKRSSYGKTHIAVDFDFNSAFDALDTKMGGGGALRIGRKYGFLLVSLTPEIGGNYHAFGGNDETRLYSGFLGGRLGFGSVVEPSIFAHWGFAHLEGLQERSGSVLDAGLALDVTILPLIDFGVHGGYNVMPNGDGDALKFMTLGAQVALVL